MNDVIVIFSGICLWWLTTPGYVLIPDLASHNPAHHAWVEAPATAFDGNTCPDRFVETNGNCSFALNGAGAAGGVQIQLRTATPAGKFAAGAFCAIPPLERDGPLVLKPAYTPPLGDGNVAWMEAAGGIPASKIDDCPEERRPCRRFVEWTVPAKAPDKVVFVLGNLRSGAPISAVLNGGATIKINNSPPVKTQDDRFHWCAYYEMVGLANTSVPPQCRFPTLPDRCVVPPPNERARSTRRLRYDTIACSNSQYP